jgi:hypothetical protein
MAFKIFYINSAGGRHLRFHSAENTTIAVGYPGSADDYRLITHYPAPSLISRAIRSPILDFVKFIKQATNNYLTDEAGNIWWFGEITDPDIDAVQSELLHWDQTLGKVVIGSEIDKPKVHGMRQGFLDPSSAGFYFVGMGLYETYFGTFQQFAHIIANPIGYCPGPGEVSTYGGSYTDWRWTVGPIGPTEELTDSPRTIVRLVDNSYVGAPIWQDGSEVGTLLIEGSKHFAGSPRLVFHQDNLWYTVFTGGYVSAASGGGMINYVSRAGVYGITHMSDALDPSDWSDWLISGSSPEWIDTYNALWLDQNFAAVEDYNGQVFWHVGRTYIVSQEADGTPLHFNVDDVCIGAMAQMDGDLYFVSMDEYYHPSGDPLPASTPVTLTLWKYAPTEINPMNFDAISTLTRQAGEWMGPQVTTMVGEAGQLQMMIASNSSDAVAGGGVAGWNTDDRANGGADNAEVIVWTAVTDSWEIFTQGYPTPFLGPDADWGSFSPKLFWSDV